MTNNRRKKASPSIETQIFVSSGRRCCICFGLENDFKVKDDGQIAHLDKNRENNKIDNLAFLCLNHHNRYDSKTSVSKNFSIHEVKAYRDYLYRAVEGKREKVWSDNNSLKKQLNPHSWGMKFSLIHYMNIPRVTTSLIMEDFPGEEIIQFARLKGLRGMDFDEFHAVTNLFSSFFAKWPLPAIDLSNLREITDKYVGARIAFKHISFRTRNVPVLNEHNKNNFELTGNLDNDPCLYWDHSNKRIWLPLNPLWITTETAFNDLSPPGGVTVPFGGFAVIKQYSETSIIATPLYLGTVDPLDELDALDDFLL
ncbi:MAG: hypothetical protein GY797_22140 [Deltaproteobacteria bacterium]|nr:hypothetical protein [Deltaproteobacteria bacterium]